MWAFIVAGCFSLLSPCRRRSGVMSLISVQRRWKLLMKRRKLITLHFGVHSPGSEILMSLMSLFGKVTSAWVTIILEDAGVCRLYCEDNRRVRVIRETLAHVKTWLRILSSNGPGVTMSELDQITALMNRTPERWSKCNGCGTDISSKVEVCDLCFCRNSHFQSQELECDYIRGRRLWLMMHAKMGRSIIWGCWWLCKTNWAVMMWRL